MGFFCTFILCFLAVTLKYKSKKKWHQIIFHAGGYVIRLNKCVHRGASTREINTARARACSLSKQSGERRANNQSAQGIALGERMYQGYAPQGGTDVSRLRPAGAKSFSLPSLGLCAVILLPLQGVFTVAPLSAGRCPGLTYHCPFGALNLNW